MTDSRFIRCWWPDNSREDVDRWVEEIQSAGAQVLLAAPAPDVSMDDDWHLVFVLPRDRFEAVLGRSPLPGEELPPLSFDQVKADPFGFEQIEAIEGLLEQVQALSQDDAVLHQRLSDEVDLLEQVTGLRYQTGIAAIDSAREYPALPPHLSKDARVQQVIMTCIETVYQSRLMNATLLMEDDAGFEPMSRVEYDIPASVEPDDLPEFDLFVMPDQSEADRVPLLLNRYNTIGAVSGFQDVTLARHETQALLDKTLELVTVSAQPGVSISPEAEHLIREIRGLMAKSGIMLEEPMVEAGPFEGVRRQLHLLV